MTNRIQSLLPLVDRFLAAKPDWATDQEWFDAATTAVISGMIPDSPYKIFAQSKAWDEYSKQMFDDVASFIWDQRRAREKQK